MPTYRVKIKEYDFTQFEGEEPDKSFVQSFSLSIQAENIAEALEQGQKIVDKLNIDKQETTFDADEKLGTLAFKSWTEFRYEIEIPLSPRHLI